ncbi:hypothetical protein CANCADRAFT_86625 [Tortispora caseinolytica NRRL Y-17796]|uniref:Eukaryotic translation initiation factor 3 subunit L n=1 Tax=Tortispora caseinolytica NRRL Y-17796 TaxID=767744 RepID=A0A1E4TKY3_9ASCO|nr:hypothetical protein CANCADRAFT_86625 [Tortispora caseinolytica NRRL Y-17796]
MSTVYKEEPEELDDYLSADGDYDLDHEALVYEELDVDEPAIQEVKDLPTPIRNFIVVFYQSFVDNNAARLKTCYEVSFNKLSEKFYKNSTWPTASDIAPLVSNDASFLTFYTEMYYRHLHARLQPTLEQRSAALNNYVELFNMLLVQDVFPQLDLPISWCWDIIDEFIYQYNSFALYRERALKDESLSEEERNILSQPSQGWNCYGVFNVLYSMLAKSNIAESSRSKDEGEASASEYDTPHLLKYLGHFSIVGLLRVHSILGDFTLALDSMRELDLSKKAPLTMVPAAHISAYYYVGFAYMMLRRYVDAIKMFSHGLMYVSRTKQPHSKSVQYQTVARKSDQMYALLAICVSLCPVRLDESLHLSLRDRYGERLTTMQQPTKSALAIFSDLFVFAAPKFINPNAPESPLSDSLAHHLMLFLDDVESVLFMPTVRSYLKLYTSMHLSKLASFTEIEESRLREMLMLYNLKSRQKKWVSGELLSGEEVTSSDVDFYLDGDVLHINETKAGRRFSDWFLRNISRLYNVQDTINSSSKAGQERRSNRKQYKPQRTEKQAA